MRLLAVLLAGLLPWTGSGAARVSISRGGTIVAADGAITIDNPRVVTALELAASWIGRIAPTGVLNNAVHDILAGRYEAAAALARLARTLDRISRGGTHWQ
jgi:hypothetical protein